MEDAAGTVEKRPAPPSSKDGGKKKKAKTCAVAVELNATRYQPTLSDVQNLILRVFTSEYGENPKWVCIRGMSHVQAAVVVMVPCLSAGMIRQHRDLAPALAMLLGGPGAVSMRSAGEIQHFPGDRGLVRAACRMVCALLSAKAKPAVSSRKPLTDALAPKQRPPIATYLATEEERARSGYPSRKMASAEGWVRTAEKEDAGHGPGTRDPGPAADPAADPDRARLVGLDCEMVLTAKGQALARVSLVGPDGAPLYDALVRPAEPVTDYVTEFSGITAELLASVQVTLSDVQAKLLDLLSERSILVGHSLENDLHAMQLVHERVIDTALLYPHARGWPHRQGLAGLSASLLKRKLDRRAGHDSIEDARAALGLALLKFEKGPAFGATGGVPTPLGRLLRGACARLSLSDAAGPVPEPGSAASWHLEGCSHGDTDGEHLAGGATEAACAAAVPSRPREVRLVVLRDYEASCERGVEEGGTPGAVEARLAELDAQVARLAADVSEEELLIVLSGCGDLHRLRRLGGRADAAEEHARAQETFKDAFGVFTVGGDALRARLGSVRRDVPPQRELVSYDV